MHLLVRLYSWIQSANGNVSFLLNPPHTHTYTSAFRLAVTRCSFKMTRAFRTSNLRQLGKADVVLLCRIRRGSAMLFHVAVGLSSPPARPLNSRTVQPAIRLSQPPSQFFFVCPQRCMQGDHTHSPDSNTAQLAGWLGHFRISSINVNVHSRCLPAGSFLPFLNGETELHCVLCISSHREASRPHKKLCARAYLRGKEGGRCWRWRLTVLPAVVAGRRPGINA